MGAGSFAASPLAVAVLSTGKSIRTFMLNTIDTVIAFAVIMTVLSLLITIVVQMVSAGLSLRGKNLANALALTFQTIDPKLQKQAHSLTAQILRDPIFSDSVWRMKDRQLRGNAATQAQAKVERADKNLRLAERRLAAVKPDDAAAITRLTAARGQASNTLERAKQELKHAEQTEKVENLQVTPNRDEPWGVFSKLRDATALGSAIRPGEIYRMVHEFADLTKTEAAMRDVCPEVVEAAKRLLACLAKPDQPAEESQAKLRLIANVANLFPTQQQETIVDSLANLGATVERATTLAYDRFQRWFGSAQDRSEQWFQTHVRVVTIICSICAAFVLQLDTTEIFRQLRAEPKLVEALVKAAPGVVQKGGEVAEPSPTPASDTHEQDRKKAFVGLQKDLEDAGFDIVPRPFFGRWNKDPTPTWAHTAHAPRPVALLLAHLVGILATAGLLALGAPFWFNLLKNLMSLRPALATLIEKRPTSAPALPAAPTTPPSPS